MSLVLMNWLEHMTSHLKFSSLLAAALLVVSAPLVARAREVIGTASEWILR